MQTPIISVVVGTVGTVTGAQAQDIQQGRQLAFEVCASCHAVLPGQAQSPVAEAPSFEAIAMTPGMTATALHVWLTAHEHPTMPRIILSHQEVRDVSAYILGLRD
ncbi:c-type cytochrome [Mesorhizobium sp.]|uniref:c-type cytochrome n=1 Tax=Mesorhizobium sp. TaxID=1871066 RepID=UPI0012212F63|nr:c-type cytochrome [Mesorhizobium sp.]TIS53660.1 MAG: cytochrome c [Mesorhizobium sp.]TIS86090.1 MAG: cytochrome c [Mesorhizobium sp.]